MPAAPERNADTGRVAVVAVHGVGKQGRYSTLDKMARGLEYGFGSDRVERSHHTRRLAGRTYSYVELTPRTGVEPEQALPRGVAAVHCYEAYWQSSIRGVAHVRGVLRWLANSLLAPLRLWSQVEVHQRSRMARVNKLVAEFLRLLILPAVAFLGAVLVVAMAGGFVTWGWSEVDDEPAVVQVDGEDDAAASPESAPAAAASDSATDDDGDRRWFLDELFYVTAETFLTLLGLFLIIGGLWRAALKPRLARKAWRRRWQAFVHAQAEAPPPPPLRRIEPTKSEQIWANASVVFLALVATAVLVLGLAGRITVWDFVVDNPQVLWGPFGFLVGWRLSALLVGTVGDAAVYLTDDPESKGSEARLAMIAEVEDLLDDLLELDDYDMVHVVSHSLGSVIAYDVLNNLRLRKELAEQGERRPEGAKQPGQPLDPEAYAKLGLFVTLASPLDVVGYYFRTRVPSDRSVRYRILKERHGLRQRPDNPDDGFIDGPRHFSWLNIHSWLDPVGGHLNRYRVDRQVPIPSRGSPLATHQGMWTDARVYREIVWALRARALGSIVR